MAGDGQYDIFISYAREDAALVERLAAELAAYRWSVFWDGGLPTDLTGDAAIEDARHGAKVVDVVWSARSVASSQVDIEADQARQRGVGVAVLIDDCVPAVERDEDLADLRGWAASPRTSPSSRWSARASSQSGRARSSPMSM